MPLNAPVRAFVPHPGTTPHRAGLPTGRFSGRSIMAPIFSSAADAWLRLLMAGGLALTAGTVAGAIGFARSDYYTGARLHPPPQPVPFSHKHHVAGLGINCRYCHTSFAESARAGLPPTETCMSCHSQ